jgi:hypothetical protein
LDIAVNLLRRREPAETGKDKDRSDKETHHRKLNVN